MPSSLIRFTKVAAVLSTVLVARVGLGVDGGSGSLPPMARPAIPLGYPQAYPPQERMSVVDPDKKLTAGDKVTVEIVEDREGGLPRVVTATGELDVPPLGRVRVAGKTAADAAVSIKQLLDKEYYYNATVRLSIDQVSSTPVQLGSVLISGSVRIQGPQTLIAGESLTVTTAILKAVPTEWANLRNVQVTRLKKDGSVERFQVDVKKITETGDAKSDPVLQDGDRIDVRRKIINL
jgi:protein involved in polysaccharide export with SLBB domain